MQQGNHISDELQQLVPGAGWPSRQPFTVPEGYFHSLTDQVMQRVQGNGINPVQEELAGLSPLLAAIPKQPPFTVPDGYFRQLSATTPVIHETRVVKMPLQKRLRKWAVAATIALITGSSALFFLNREQHSSSREYQLEDLSDRDIEAYLQSHSDAFDDATIFSNTAIATEQPITEDLPDEAIQQYLQHTGYSTDMILN